MKKQFGTSSLRPGRIYTLEYNSEVKMVSYRQGNRADVNPLIGETVTVEKQIVIQAAGAKTYAAVMTRKDPTWTPSADFKAWWTPLKENTCIVEHNQNATRYLRGIPKGTNRKTYFVNGVEATAEQVETIRKFKKSRSQSDFKLVDLLNITNLVDETGDDE